MKRTSMTLLLLAVVLAGILARAEETISKADKEKSLLPNGDFEAGAVVEKGKERPKHWEPIEKEGISLVDLGPPHRHVARLDVARNVARGTGLMYYSDPIPIELGKTYDISMDIRSSGIGVIIFVKGYGTVQGGAFGGRERSLYNHKKEARLTKGEWTRFESYFTPREPASLEVLRRRRVDVPKVESVRVELYCYGGDAGVAEFDNVRIVKRASPAVSEKKEKPGKP